MCAAPSAGSTEISTISRETFSSASMMNHATTVVAPRRAGPTIRVVPSHRLIGRTRQPTEPLCDRFPSNTTRKALLSPTRSELSEGSESRARSTRTPVVAIEFQIDSCSTTKRFSDDHRLIACSQFLLRKRGAFRRQSIHAARRSACKFRRLPLGIEQPSVA